MDQAAFFDTIRQAYALGRIHTPPRKLSERVWHLSTDSGDFAVKRYAPEHGARASKEAAILAHLQTQVDARFRVQTLRRTATNEALYIGADFHALLTHWETGRFKTYDTFTLAEWEALGMSLAALHLRLDGLRLSSPDMSFDTIHARLAALDFDEIRQSLHDALTQSQSKQNTDKLHLYVDVALRLIDAHYPGALAAFPHDDPQAPIHNDYNQFNYLFADTLPPVIVDWEAAIGAPREYELVRCLNHLPIEAPQLAEAFVRAYVRVRPVRPECVAWAVDAACLQHALKLWVVRGWLDDPARFAAHLNGAVTMATAMAGAREPLIAFFSRCVEAGS